MNSIVTHRFIKCHNELQRLGKVRSSRQFAMMLDYLPQSLSEILKLRRDVTLELLRKSVEVFQLNPLFLLKGEGEMFLSESEQKGLKILTIVTNPQNKERIVHVPIPAQAGYANALGDPVFVQELESYSLPDDRYKTGSYRSFDVAGDSMESLLREGDKVVCSFVESNLWHNSLKENDLYVVVTKSDILVKRINYHHTDKKRIVLVSDNLFYEPYEIPFSKISEIWQVRTKITTYLPSPKNVQEFEMQEKIELKKTVEEQGRTIENLNRTIELLLSKRK